MDNRSRRTRLFIRRTIVCFCIAAILTSLVWGITVGIHALCRVLTDDSGYSKLQNNGSGTVSSALQPPSAEGSGEMPGTGGRLKSGQPEDGAAVAESWFNDAVFIGDSRTQGLQDYDGLGDAEYYAIKGLMVSTVYTKPAVKLNGTKISVMQALRRKKFGKVYIMLGVNELGWSSFQSFVDGYGKMVDDIRKDQPEAKVYLQSILPVTAQKSTSSGIYTNPKISNYNDAIRKLAEQKNVKYLAVNTALEDSSGALPADATADGIHLNSTYCRKWCDFLKTHTG